LELSTKTAFLRLLVANAIGLWPVMALMGWEMWRGRTPGGKKTSLRFLLPFLTVMLELAVMRNYFGHHPWMSCNFILLGMILSFVAWKSTHEETAAPGKIQASPFLQWGALALAFGYAFTVLLFDHVHNGQELALIKFIRDSTARPAVILIARDTDPALAKMEGRLPELFDRRVVVLDKAADAGAEMTNGYWLTAVKNDGHQLAARSDGRDAMGELPLVKQMLEWYGRDIAHRRPGDKLEFGGEYYLYH
jgi:hypothetical protein